MYGHQYTDDEKAFLKEFVPGHSHKEIQAAFTERFGWEITRVQVSSSIKRYGLNTGRTGRFEKGCTACNKGVPMSKEVYEKVSRTMFKPGNMPVNHRAVGSERVNVDGYIEIKVAEPNKWRLKHNIVWEQHHGSIPKGSVIVFLDSNKLNVDISNLKLISRSELLIMNRHKLFQADAELTEAAVNVAKVINAGNKAKKRKE